MGNIFEKPKPLSSKELSEREYKRKENEIKISRIRAGVVRKQIIEAYQIIENIRFDYIGDTAFRSKITGAKQNLEKAICDFLLDDGYWKKQIQEHKEKTPSDFLEVLKTKVAQSN